jgi:hypothetical protein
VDRRTAEEARRPRGRPRKVTSEAVHQIERLRRDGLSWETIGQHLGLKPETCRRAFWLVRKGRGAVGNPPGAVNNPAREG